MSGGNIMTGELAFELATAGVVESTVSSANARGISIAMKLWKTPIDVPGSGAGAEVPSDDAGGGELVSGAGGVTVGGGVVAGVVSEDGGGETVVSVAELFVESVAEEEDGATLVEFTLDDDDELAPVPSDDDVVALL
jgi:hypothetical protein